MIRIEAAREKEISVAIDAARGALASWSSAPMDERVGYLRALEQIYRIEKEKIARAISAETQKPFWESRLEVDSMINKIPISIEAYQERCREQTRPVGDAVGFTRFRAHGVLAVFGPFNMPGHLPNGHIVPALLAGNTVIFKPSEQTPGVGQVLGECFVGAGFPRGVMGVVQGGKEVGAAIATHRDVNGILFTGSTAGGIALRRATVDEPGKILALEMGGNNPLIVHQAHDLVAAAYLIIQSAFITAGQRCSCVRRLILVHGPECAALLHRLAAMVGSLRVGLPTDDPEPFMGPVISVAAAENVLAAQSDFVRRGGVAMVEMKASPRSAALLTPGLIDVTNISDRADVEIFGPLLQVIRVDNFDAAIREGNRTAFGLSAGLISDRGDLYQKFLNEIRAGVLAWNRPMTGASSHQPFGGVGRSGNYRPGGYFAADYAAHPVVSVESPRAVLPEKMPPGVVL